MASSAEPLRRSRAAAWRKEAIPYLRYMAQSGLPGFAALAAITGLIGYNGFLRDIPEGFPIAAVGAAVLTPLLAWSPLRTYLAAADTVFLMPREHGMGRYMQRAQLLGYLLSAALLAAVWLLYIPLYGKGDYPSSAAVLTPLLLVVKAANAAGAWQERRTAWPAARRLCRLMRWALTAAGAAALLMQPLPAAAGFILLAALLAAAVYRLPVKHRFPWERLQIEEARTRRRYYRFFNSFIDVPVIAPSVSRRPYAAWVAERIGHTRKHAYLLLHTLTLIRTETGGILLRQTGLGMLAGWAAAAGGFAAGWAGAAVACVFAASTGVQAGMIRQAHRHAVWRHLYPLPERERHRSIAAAAFGGHLVCAVPIGLAAALPLFGLGYLPAAAAALAGPLILAALLTVRMRRKLVKEREDE